MAASEGVTKLLIEWNSGNKAFGLKLYFRELLVRMVLWRRWHERFSASRRPKRPTVSSIVR